MNYEFEESTESIMNYGLLRYARNDEHRARSALVFIAVCDSARNGTERKRERDTGTGRERNDEHRARSALAFIAVCDSARNGTERKRERDTGTETGRKRDGNGTRT